MPTTFSDLVPVRRVAVGDCSGPLGSGFDALARSAYAALLAAEWAEDASAPFLPVHDNGQTANKTIPHGDSWKCTYGYDGAARTERSACGAVCYTFAIPADATTGTAANIVSVALSLTGDRYLDAGVDLYILPSSSAVPPTVSSLLAETPVSGSPFCATSGQSPTPPNQRSGVTAPVTASLGVAAQPYLHVALLLHDYTTNRGAWIEGGAMLDGAAATITFSRAVASDGAQGISLFAVTGEVQDEIYDYAHVQTLAFAAGSRYFRFSANPATSGADAGRMLSLFAANALFDNWQILYFKVALNSGDFGLYRIYSRVKRTEEEVDRSLQFDIGSIAYHNPRVPLAGRSIVVPNVTSTSAARVRVGFVQSSANPGLGNEQTDASIRFAVPWNQFLDGEGADLLGFVDVNLAANTAADVSVPFAKTPSADFLYPIAFPIDGSRTEVTVKNSISSTTPPWRLNT